MATQNKRRFPFWQLAALGTLCVVASFGVGVKLSTEFRSISPLEAEDSRITGDIDGSGSVDLRDVILILEVARGYRDTLPDELKADPNGDGRLTIDDAIRLLHDLHTSQAR